MPARHTRARGRQSHAIMSESTTCKVNKPHSAAELPKQGSPVQPVRTHSGSLDSDTHHYCLLFGLPCPDVLPGGLTQKWCGVLHKLHCECVLPVAAGALRLLSCLQTASELQTSSVLACES